MSVEKLILKGHIDFAVKIFWKSSIVFHNTNLPWTFEKFLLFHKHEILFLVKHSYQSQQDHNSITPEKAELLPKIFFLSFIVSFLF